MEGLILVIIGVVLYNFIFRKTKSDLVRFKEALKDISTDDLKFLNELIEIELKKRN